jgi:uncharacterized BrkB/YihY/UPF0761 family membrane protein
MEPGERERAAELAAPASRLARVRSRAASARAAGRRYSQRAQDERERHASVDALFDMAERDGEVGGGIIAAALAYRVFIWLLPAALVAVAGLGFAAEASSESPEQTAESLGLKGLVSSSIAHAANSPNRWYALVIGIPALIWATRSVLRVLIGAHRLVWTDDRTRAPKPQLVASLRLLGIMLCFAVVAGAASAVRAASTGAGVLATLLALVPYAGLWLLVAVRLPHRDAPWPALLPGAAMLAAGIEVLHVVIAYAITPWAIAKQGTYGALGAGAALLAALFLISRLVVASAVANATLWERRSTRGA